ncbi:MAG: vitamin K epoxide reductase family protein [Gemmatirosa sp.]
MTYRMALALVALVDAIVALYLHLWKLGLAGTLSCGAEHGCEVVQLSSYGWFFGVDVALIGAVGWGTVFVLAVLGTLPRWEEARWPTIALAALVVPALLFTLRLKYGEFVVLRSFCPWCAINAVIVVIASVLVALDWRRLRRDARDDLPVAA